MKNAFVGALILVLALAALAVAQDAPPRESHDEPTAFEDETETVLPVRLRTDRRRQIVEVMVHLWGLPQEQAGAGPARAAEPAPRTLEVTVEDPPSFIRNLRVLQAAPALADAEPRFEPGSTVVFGAAETARPVRIEFDLEKTAAPADERGEASGEIVVRIASSDPQVVPQRRRLVLPLRFRPEGEPPATTAAVVQVWVQHVKPAPPDQKPQPGARIFANARAVTFAWEDLTPANAHKQDAYARLTWAEATKDRQVIARGHVSGGIPELDTDFEDRGARNLFGAPFRREFELAVELPDLRLHAGPMRVTGRLLAFDAAAVSDVRDANRFDESKVVASLPFEVTVQIPPPTLTAKGKGALNRSDGRLWGSISLSGVQAGRRVARVDFGTGVRFALLNGERAAGGVSFEATGQTQAPRTATVTFRNFGEDVTVTAELEMKVSGERKPADVKELTRLQTRLTARQATPYETLKHVAGARRAIVRWAEDETSFDPEFWVQVCNAWFEAERQVADAAGDGNWAGWQGRSPNAAYLADERRTYLYATIYDRLQSAERAHRFGIIDAPRTWLGVCEAELAAVFSDDPDRLTRELGSIASAYKKHADVTFRLTGDVDAATALVRHAEALWQQQRGGAPGPSEKTGFEIDPEYRR